MTDPGFPIPDSCDLIHRLFFNNAEEVKGLALMGGSWREPGRVWRGETGLDCIDPFVL
jgi:hypothetical protein